MASHRLWFRETKLVPFGKYCRKSPLVFSFHAKAVCKKRQRYADANVDPRNLRV